MAESDSVPKSDLLAALYARDRAYLQLGRLAGLLRGAQFPPNSLSRALQDIDDPSLSRLRIFALGVHGAAIRFAGQPDYRPPTYGAAARLLVRAADNLSAAGDLLATHIEWVPHGSQSKVGRVRLTFHGQAIVAGVERDAAVGELARVAVALMRVDHVLATEGMELVEPYAGDHVHGDIRRFVASRFNEVLGGYARAAPATRLRSLQPAAVWKRSTGAHAATTLQGVVEVAAAVSNAIRDDRNTLTVALLRSVARLGFATTVAAGIAAGEGAQPSEGTASKTQQWKALGLALETIRDVRDNVAPELAIEVRQAAAWLRDQVRTESGPFSQIWAGYVLELEGSLRWICSQAIDRLRKALIDRHLLTAVTELGEVRAGVHVAQKRWEIAVPSDGEVSAVLYCLDDLGMSAKPWTAAAAVSKAFPHAAKRSSASRASRSTSAEGGPRGFRRAAARDEFTR